MRLLCTEVWPTLYNVLTCQTKKPLDVWGLPKEKAIALIDEEEPVGREIRRFYRSLHQYYEGARSVEGALTIIEQGIRFRRLAKDWYESIEPTEAQ